MNDFVTWDIETKGLGGELVIGGIYTGSSYYEFKDWNTLFFMFKSGVIPAKSNLFAHNAGKYDNRYVMEQAKKHGFEISSIQYIQNGVVFTLKLGKKRWYFRDSYHLMPESLKSLCESFEIEHSKKEFDIKKWMTEGYKITDELKTYLYYDCVSLYELIDKFSELMNNDVKQTIASTAFNKLLQTEYKNIKLKKLLANFMKKEHERDIRFAYKGGRVEVFTRHGENLYKYDVNSLYPHVMKKYDYPFAKYHVVSNSKYAEKYIARGELGVYYCGIECPYMKYPYLGKKYNNKLIFPVGEWVDWLTSFEIIEARKRGYKIDISHGYTFERKGHVFENYVNEYYKIKQSSTGAKKKVAKLILNSAYGKFGQKRVMRQLVTEDELIKKDIPITEVQQVTNDLYQYERESYANRQINPVIAVFVTAYARHELYLGMENIIEKGGNIYYVDTDCIVSDKQLDEEMIDSDELGLWDCEDENIIEGVFISPKLYSIRNKNDVLIKAKGIDSEMQKELSFRKMKSLLHNEDEIPFQKNRVAGFMEHFKRLATDKNNYISNITSKRSISGKYDKRVLRDDRINTEPIKL